MKKRICIIGLPRTGSNYLAELIKKNCENFTNLGEPFTPDFPLTIVKNHNGVLIYWKTSNRRKFIDYKTIYKQFLRSNIKFRNC